MKPWVLAAFLVWVSAAAACGGEGDGGSSTNSGGAGGAGGAETTTTDTTTTADTTTTTTSTSMQSMCEMSSSDCDTCRGCATTTGSCADELATCGNSAACTQIYDCALTCETGCTGNPNPNCVDGCINGQGGCVETYPGGATEYQAVFDCVTTAECPTLCGGAM